MSKKQHGFILIAGLQLAITVAVAIFAVTLDFNFKRTRHPRPFYYPLLYWYQSLRAACKRAADLTVSLLALIVLAPLFGVISAIIMITAPGPVFYKATRVGRQGRLFKLYKFRSMVVNADKAGPGITLAGDNRITKIGKLLRRTKLDELPQLINVLRGDMSLVGPRPEDPRYVAMYTPEQLAVLQAKPGITSLASVRFHHEESLHTGTDWETRYVKEIMPAKLSLDLEYVRRPSLRRDFKIITQTFSVMAL